MPRKLHLFPDALARRPDHLCATLKLMNTEDPNLTLRIRYVYKHGVWAGKLINAFRNGKQLGGTKAKTQKINSAFNTVFLYRIGGNSTLPYIPEYDNFRNSLILHFHNVGHLGIGKVYNACAENTYWPKMIHDIRNYISHCKVRQTQKIPTQPPPGLFQTLAIPDQRSDMVTMDFLKKLPVSESANGRILVMIDKLSRRAILEPLKMQLLHRTSRKYFRIACLADMEYKL